MLTKEVIVQLLGTNDEKGNKALCRALVLLNERQTNDEQASETTRHHNGRGFRPCHARMGTSMANFYTRRGYLTEKQLAYWRVRDKSGAMRIGIYAGQLLEEAEKKAKQVALLKMIQSAPPAPVNVIVPGGDLGLISNVINPVDEQGRSQLHPDYKGDEDVGNMMERRMVLQEMVESGDPKVEQELNEIDNFIERVRNKK